MNVKQAIALLQKCNPESELRVDVNHCSRPAKIVLSRDDETVLGDGDTHREPEYGFERVK